MAGTLQGATRQAKMREFGRRAARRLFEGRKGHGGGVVAARRFTEAELAALLALAFDEGYSEAKLVAEPV